MQDGQYEVKKINGKKQYVHRLVMEKTIGRPLSRNEVVHHKDGDIRNNDPENLTVMSLSEHTARHNASRVLSAETKEKIAEKHRGRPNLKKRTYSDKRINEIISAVNNGISCYRIAKDLGMTYSTVRSIYLREENGKLDRRVV